MRSGAALVIVNLGEMPLDDLATVRIEAKAGPTIPATLDAIRRRRAAQGVVSDRYRLFIGRPVTGSTAEDQSWVFASACLPPPGKASPDYSYAWLNQPIACSVGRCDAVRSSVAEPTDRANACTKKQARE